MGVDANLGILDWEPTEEESQEYIRRRTEMGDKWAERNGDQT